MLNYGFIEGIDFYSFLLKNELASKMTENVCTSKIKGKKQRGGT